MRVVLEPQTLPTHPYVGHAIMALDGSRPDLTTACCSVIGAYHQ
jgi:hypothetical protein